MPKNFLKVQFNDIFENLLNTSNESDERNVLNIINDVFLKIQEKGRNLNMVNAIDKVMDEYIDTE